MKGIRNSRSGTEVGFPIVGRVIAIRRSRTKDHVAGNNDRYESRVFAALMETTATVAAIHFRYETVP